MIVRYAPGALVARQRPTVALARLLEPTVVPWAVISNGMDALVLDATTGKPAATGLSGIFRRGDLAGRVAQAQPITLTAAQRAAEARIAAAFAVLECDCRGPG